MRTGDARNGTTAREEAARESTVPLTSGMPEANTRHEEQRWRWRSTVADAMPGSSPSAAADTASRTTLHNFVVMLNEPVGVVRKFPVRRTLV